MCVKIVTEESEIAYDMTRPLEEQLEGSQMIIVNYQPFDKEVDKFLSEVERFAKTGVDANLNIQVVHNDNIYGYRMMKRLKKASNDITLNEVIKLMVLSHCETDKKLKDLKNTFMGKKK